MCEKCMNISGDNVVVVIGHMEAGDFEAFEIVQESNEIIEESNEIIDFFKNLQPVTYSPPMREKRVFNRDDIVYVPTEESPMEEQIIYSTLMSLMGKGAIATEDIAKMIMGNLEAYWMKQDKLY